ncbi:FAST kinase domain-containing protein 5, mitochondrial [Andrena cerasifolii]|uniref:FAST kinase domain-containing protein 5, mitochondrial n=1 Tax=Andrena cerasifolii TaxID=2819439 RepID=UPI0040376134
MNIVTRTIFSCNYDQVKTLVLRLCKKSHCTPSIKDVSRSRTLVTLQRSSESYKYLLHSRRYANIAINADKEDRFTSTRLLEHEMMHSMLKNSMFYRDTVMPTIKTKVHVTPEEIQMLDNKDWSSESSQVVYKALKTLTYGHLHGLHIQQKTFNDILQAFGSKLSELDNTEIQKLMQCLVILNNFLKKSSAYKEFINSLSAECLKRFFSANWSELLLIIDGFYQMKAWDANYMWRALRKVGGRPYKLSSKQVVQFLFLMSICQVPDINLYELQCRFEESLPDISGNEVGIAARGFFMNEKKIHNKSLMEKMITKVANTCGTMENVTLAAVMKLIRYSDCCHCLGPLQNLFISVRAEIPRLPLVCLTHIVHTLGGQRFYDKILLDSIVKKMKNEIKLARIKDIERLIYTLCIVSPPTEYHDVCNELVNEIIHTYKSCRSEEIHSYRKSLPRIIMFLTFKNIYPRELIEYALDPTYVKSVYEHSIHNLTNELFVVNGSVQIDVPDYTGPFLENHIYKCLVKKFCRKSDILERHSAVKLRTEIIFLCKEMLGLEVYNDWLVPHYLNTDTVLAFDEHNNSISAEPILSKMPFGTIKRVDSDDLKKIQWKILYPCTVLQRVMGHDGYIGALYAKFRQLRAIGYTPIPIHENEWTSCNTDSEKCNYLKQAIFQDPDSNFSKGEAF